MRPLKTQPEEPRSPGKSRIIMIADPTAEPAPITEDPPAPLDLPEFTISQLLKSYPTAQEFRAGIILFTEWDILTVQEKSSHRVGFPKGTYESTDGGSLRTTALREFFEETGINPFSISEGKFLQTIELCHISKKGIPDESILYFVVFLPEKFAKKLTLRQPKTEIERVCWTPINEHHTLFTSSYTRQALQKFIPRYAKMQALGLL